MNNSPGTTATAAAPHVPDNHQQQQQQQQTRRLPQDVEEAEEQDEALVVIQKLHHFAQQYPELEVDDLLSSFYRAHTTLKKCTSAAATLNEAQLELVCSAMKEPDVVKTFYFLHHEQMTLPRIESKIMLSELFEEWSKKRLRGLRSTPSGAAPAAALAASSHTHASAFVAKRARFEHEEPDGVAAAKKPACWDEFTQKHEYYVTNCPSTRKLMDSQGNMIKMIPVDICMSASATEFDDMANFVKACLSKEGNRLPVNLVDNAVSFVQNAKNDLLIRVPLAMFAYGTKDKKAGNFAKCRLCDGSINCISDNTWHLRLGVLLNVFPENLDTSTLTVASPHYYHVPCAALLRFAGANKCLCCYSPSPKAACSGLARTGRD